MAYILCASACVRAQEECFKLIYMQSHNRDQQLADVIGWIKIDRMQWGVDYQFPVPTTSRPA